MKRYIYKKEYNKGMWKVLFLIVIGISSIGFVEGIKLNIPVNNNLCTCTGVNSSINETYLNNNYWKRDGSNSPPTAEWDMMQGNSTNWGLIESAEGNFQALSVGSTMTIASLIAGDVSLDDADTIDCSADNEKLVTDGTGLISCGTQSLTNYFTLQSGYITNSTTSGLNVSGNIIAQTQLQSQSAYLRSSAPELQMVVDASGALVRSIFKTQFLNSNRYSNVSMFGYAGAFNSSGDYNPDFVYINPDVLQNNFLGHNTGSPFKFHKGGNFSINEDLSTSVARISVVGSLATASGSEPMLWFEKPISGGVSWAQVGQIELGRATGQTGTNPNSAFLFKLKNAATNANPNVVDTTVMEMATTLSRIYSPLNVTNQTITSYIQLRANTTSITCNSANAGSIYYDGSALKHYGCNSTTWNALY